MTKKAAPKTAKSAANAAANAQLVLAVGKEQVLVQRVIEQAVVAARKADPLTVRQDIVASNESAASELSLSLSPSLFGEPMLVIVTGIDNATEDLGSLLEQAVTDIPEHVRLVITHPGGVKGKRLLDIIRKAGAAEANCGELKKADLEAALVAEFKKHNRKVTSDAISALQEAVGSDLAELLAAVSQLSSDIESDMIDASDVAQYYEGVNDVAGYQLSDAMWNATPIELLQKLSWALERDPGSGVVAAMAIASGLRTLVRYASAPAGLSENELAAHVGCPPWKLRYLRSQKMKWNPDQLAQAAHLLVLADRASKGTVYDAHIPGGRSLENIQVRYHLEQSLLGIRPPT